MPVLVQRLIEFFIDKKKLVGWISAFAIAVLAAATGMQSQEFKDAVCGAPVIALPSAPAPVVPEAK